MPRISSRKPSRASWSIAALAVAALTAPSSAIAQGVAETHTVRKGDTLWDLAKQYRRDPFLWPDIYRLNTAVVEDPHWIYPGEVLRLSGADNVHAVPSVDTPAPANPPSAGAGDTVGRSAQARATPSGDKDARQLPDLAPGDSGYVPLFSTGTRQILGEVLRAYTDRTYQPLRMSEFYASGFLTEGQALPIGTVLGPLIPSQIRSVSNRDVASLYTEIGVAPPQGTTYQVGDSLLVARIGAEIEGYGNVVMPTGLARITGATEGRYVATVVAVFGTIRKGQIVLPADRFTPGPKEHAKPVADGVRGTLLGGRGRQELKAPQMVVFFDKGRQDGVAPGDLFEARRKPRVLADGALRVDEVMAKFQVVRVGERTATARVLNVLSPDLPPGTEVRQVAKLP